jgi:hypothetical protein
MSTDNLPVKGTPEWDALPIGLKMRISKLRAKEARAALSDTQDVRPMDLGADIDVDPESGAIDPGRPRNVPMARASSAPKRGRPPKADRATELAEGTTLDYLKQITDFLGTREGHEHWRRDDDELELVVKPAVRCYNRLDASLREKIQAASDPVALIIAVTFIFGPSIAQEVRNLQPSRPSSRSLRPSIEHRPEPPRQANPGPGGHLEHAAATVATNSAEPIPVPEGISPVGVI